MGGQAELPGMVHCHPVGNGERAPGRLDWAGETGLRAVHRSTVVERAERMRQQLHAPIRERWWR